MLITLLLPRLKLIHGYKRGESTLLTIHVHLRNTKPKLLTLIQKSKLHNDSNLKMSNIFFDCCGKLTVTDKTITFNE